MLDPARREADLLVSAQTGSGKTVAFGISLAPTLMGDREALPPPGQPLALIVAPTRELAMQVRRELEWLYAEAGASLASCVGGMDMRTERNMLQRGAHIVVGTPGRLRDHIERGSLRMDAIRVVVLDEADEMLDLGFREDLEFVLEAAPAERRTLMFSATVPRMIASLAKRYQRNAERVTTAAEQRQHTDIDYRALTVAPRDRENTIINVLLYHEPTSAIVFCATREAVNRMTSRFTNRGFPVVALSGELSQGQRTHALQAMRDGRARVCIATDVAARGLDLPDLELVIHADLPQNSQVLLHRSGRTGRAGRKGTSVLIVPHSQRRKTERLLSGGKITAEWAAPPSAVEVVARDNDRILADPALAAPVEDADRSLVAGLLEQYTPEQIAAAFVSKHRAGRSAPEDLQESGPTGDREKRKPRKDFEGGVWFSLNVGRKQRAETRWLLPMLYKAGDIAQGDIGAIRIQDTETHVEIAPASVERFQRATGDKGVLEKNIRARRLDGTPEPVDHQTEHPAGKTDKAAEKSRPRKSKPGKPGARKFASAEGGKPAKKASADQDRKRKPFKKKNRPGPEGKTDSGGYEPRRRKPRKP